MADEKETKFYVGDGVYVEFDTPIGEIVLTTEDGLHITNRIVLDRVYFSYLVEIIKHYYKA